MALKTQPKPLRRPNKHCRLCSGWRQAANICVPGRGSGRNGQCPERLDVLFVGEQPGAEEDAKCMAFIGQAGGVFNTFVQHYLSDQYTWYITNSIRCFLGRKPNKELVKPAKEHLEACRTYLEDEIQYYQPKVIVPLGKIALGQVLGVWYSRLKMQNHLVKETPTQWGIPCFALYHPAWVVRGGIDSLGEGPNIAGYEQQFQKLQDYLEGRIREYPGKWEYIEDPGALEKVYADYLLPALHKTECRPTFDYETMGLNPYSDGFRMVGYSLDGHKAIVHPLRTGKELYLHQLFIKQADHLTVHHALFDLAWVRIKLGFEAKATIYDTKFLAFLIDENQSFELKDLIDRYVPEFSGWKGATEDIGLEAPDHLWAERCAFDCMATYRLRNILIDKLTVAQKKLYMEILGPMIKALIECRVNGWKTEVSVLEELKNHHESRMAKALEKVLEYPEARAIHEQVKDGLNLNSSTVQVPRLLKAIGIDDEDHRQAARPDRMSTAEAVLKKYVKVHPIVPAIIEFREARKVINTFIKPFLDQAETGGYVRPVYNWGGRVRESQGIGGTQTGRLSASLVMNFDPTLKAAFVSRFDGGTVMIVDYAQGEYRLMGSLANDRGIIAAYQRGVDFHAQVAEKLGLSRDLGKKFNFAVGYGGGAALVAEELGVSENVAEGYIRDYWESQPGLLKEASRIKMLATSMSEVEGVFGQVLHCPDAQSGNWMQRLHAMRRAVNFRPQNALALLCLRSMGRLHVELKKPQWQSLLIGNYHDALILDIHPDDDLEALKALIVQIMRDEPDKLYIWVRIPMEVDFKIGESM